MTTGVCCTTPGCDGLAPAKDHRCRDSERDATAGQLSKTARRILAAMGREADKEAGP